MNQSLFTNNETPEEFLTRHPQLKDFLAHHPQLTVDSAKELGRLLAIHGLDLLDAAVFCTLHGIQMPDEVLVGWTNTRKDVQ